MITRYCIKGLVAANVGIINMPNKLNTICKIILPTNDSEYIYTSANAIHNKKVYIP